MRIRFAHLLKQGVPNFFDSRTIILFSGPFLDRIEIFLNSFLIKRYLFSLKIPRTGVWESLNDRLISGKKR
jgi:hypothetical protein